MCVSAGSGTGFIISINVREAGSTTESTGGKLQRARWHRDGIPQGIVSDDSVPLPLHKSQQLHAFLPVQEKHHAESVMVFPLTDYCLCTNKHTSRQKRHYFYFYFTVQVKVLDYTCVCLHQLKMVLRYTKPSSVLGRDGPSDIPWKQLRQLRTCPEGSQIFFWLKWISIKEVTCSEKPTSPVCKGPGTSGTPSLICFKPKRLIIVLIWQAANSQAASSRMHSISNIKLLALQKKIEMPFEWKKVRCHRKTLRNPWYPWQGWNSASAIILWMVQIFNQADFKVTHLEPGTSVQLSLSFSAARNVQNHYYYRGLYTADFTVKVRDVWKSQRWLYITFQYSDVER